MPTTISFIFAPEDEKLFCGFLAQFDLTAYPERIPQGYEPFAVNAENAGLFEGESYYLAAERLGPVSVHSVKKGKDKGFLVIDEVDSPVMHYLRSYTDENGELRSGRVWTELNLTGDMQRNPAFPDTFRKMFVQIRDHLLTRYLRSSPAGWTVGIHAAKKSKAGGILREEGRKGILLKPYKPA